MIYSASLATSANVTSTFDHPVVRQLIYAALGLGLMVAVMFLDYRILGNLAPTLYCLTLILLALVLVFGESTYGARRWIDLYLFPLQPSEIAKLFMVIILAKFLADHKGRIHLPHIIAISIVIITVPAVLVYFEPDLGTMLIFAAIWLGMIVMIGAKLWHLGTLAGTTVLILPFVYFRFLHEYMRGRFSVFLNPESDPLGAGFAVLQSEISVGSGGLFGKGFANGTQSQLHFLRIQKTDFIFSVLGEELGFIGALVLFSLFAILLFRALSIATLTPDPFGRLIAIGVVTTILFQVFINVGGNTRLLPMTGMPLPFISLGGSSLITTMISLGILQSIRMRHQRLEFR